MSKVEIIAIIFAVGILAFRIYQKYIKKEKPDKGNGVKDSAGKVSGLSSADDDYEPYARK